MNTVTDSYNNLEVAYDFHRHQPVGYTLPCPRCNSHRSYYSASLQDWVCMDCKLVFDVELATLSQMVGRYK